MGLSLKRFGKTSLWCFLVAAVGGASGLLGMLTVVYGLVYFGDDSNLKKATILARINEETNIYMLDEKTPVGSIFANAHRRYVPIDEIPPHMINAIVAAEDKNFYNHHGVDPVAILNAGLGYLKTGHMRGASTLTQQTARNILGWWEVTLSRKFREWIAALQLERLYSKKQILEFYLNQFYVSGNGNGIGIAAKYYFNKDVRDLDLVESAFIAGSVKGPSQYDPFIKFTREGRERAMKRAWIRKNYVIRRMYEQGWITEEQFKQAWKQPVKFNRGKFRTDEVSLVHLIRQQLNRKEILSALGIDDPRELSAAGLKIYTTIDSDLQTAAQLSVRRNLARLETILKGFKPEKAEYFQKMRSLTVNDFYFGRLAAVGGTAKKPELKLSFGLPTCSVPYDSLMRYAKWVDLPWGRGWQRQVSDILKKVKVGNVLYVEVKEYNSETHDGVCELMKRPRVNGGLIALDKGEVRAVVSGFDTKGFNRAMQAKRQPGSVFKPVVFFGSLQLGWSILDRLDNERQIFPFQGRFYYPRPDHDSPYKEVSMLWAGVMSENCAAVSLTSKLVDKLNFDQFKQLMGVMDLLPHTGEPPRDYHYRVARAMGVQLDNDGVREYQLTNALNDLMLDVQYSSTSAFQQQLRKMWYGRGYAAEMQAVLQGDDSATQKAIKLKLDADNFQRLEHLDQQLASDWALVAKKVQEKGVEGALADPQAAQAIGRFRVLPGLSKPALGYTMLLDGERPAHAARGQDEVEHLIAMPGRPLGAIDLSAIWGGNSLFGSADIKLDDVLVDGWLPHANLVTLALYVDKHYQDVMSRSTDYDLGRYYQHHDFRIALGLNYLVSLAHAMGVTSQLEPVLSFPLGTNVVTLAEVAKIYQTFVSGKTYRYYKEGPPNQLNFIRRIEDRYGNTLYEPKRADYQLVAPEFGLQMREILRRVVTNGTGRQAHAELYLTLGGGSKTPGGKPVAGEKRIRIPAFGKTGTTNDYNNANFAGFLPYPVEKGAPLDAENSYVLAAYTGYDLNKTMAAGYIHVTGALGALPAWIGLAKAIIDKKKYVDMLDTLDLSLIARQEWPLKTDPRATPLAVDMPRGVVLGGGGADQEGVAMTDTAREGESRHDEYRANVVQATVRMPMDGGAPLRLFSPYKQADQLKAIPQITPSRIQPQVPSPAKPAAADVRYYDKNANRDGIQAGAAAAPVAASAAQPAAPLPNGPKAAGGMNGAQAAPAHVDPANVFKDIGGDGKVKAKDKKSDDEDDAPDNELW